jgi:2-aminoadipate transaminase
MQFDLNLGYPNLDVVPKEILADLANDVICANRGLQYGGDLKGVQVGREHVAQFLQDRTGDPVGPENLLITTGSLQGIDIVCRALCMPGDVVAVESPTFFFGISILQMSHVQVVGVPMLADGVDLDKLDALAAEYGSRFKLLYTIATHQNPTGICTTVEHRRKLMGLAKRRNFTVLEDTAYQFLSYNGEAPPMLRHFDESSDYAVTVGSFSKVIAPSLRQGWIWAPPEQIEQFVTYKSDASASLLTTEILVEYLKRGGIDAQIAFLRESYGRRCSVMAEALKAHMPEWATWDVPKGGFFIWVRLWPEFSATRLREMTRARSMDFMPGKFSYPDDVEDRYVRLCFTYADEDALEPGVAILGECLKNY